MLLTGFREWKHQLRIFNLLGVYCFLFVSKGITTSFLFLALANLPISGGTGTTRKLNMKSRLSVIHNTEWQSCRNCSHSFVPVRSIAFSFILCIFRFVYDKVLYVELTLAVQV